MSVWQASNNKKLRTSVALEFTSRFGEVLSSKNTETDTCQPYTMSPYNLQPKLEPQPTVDTPEEPDDFTTQAQVVREQTAGPPCSTKPRTRNTYFHHTLRRPHHLTPLAQHGQTVGNLKTVGTHLKTTNARVLLWSVMVCRVGRFAFS
jgi:hypothetical protein